MRHPVRSHRESYDGERCDRKGSVRDSRSQVGRARRSGERIRAHQRFEVRTQSEERSRLSQSSAFACLAGQES